jgi:hypothetical protein
MLPQRMLGLSGGYPLILLTIPALAFAGGLHRSMPKTIYITIPALLFVIIIVAVLAAPERLPETLLFAIRMSAVIYSALIFACVTPSREALYLIKWARLGSFGIALFFAFRGIPIALEQLDGMIRTMKARGLWPISRSLPKMFTVRRWIIKIPLALLKSCVWRLDRTWIALKIRGGWDKATAVPLSAKSVPAGILFISHMLLMGAAVIFSLMNAPR